MDKNREVQFESVEPEGCYSYCTTSICKFGIPVYYRNEVCTDPLTGEKATIKHCDC